MTQDPQPSESKKTVKSFRRNLIEWAVTLVLCGSLLYFFAPPSWWQFGVSDVSDRPAPQPVVLRNLDGSTWNLADQRDKVVVVNYWATWCGPCRFETPGLVTVSSEFAPRGVEFIGVNVDADPAAIAPFVEEFKIPYRIVRAGNDPNIADDSVLPTTILYDRRGAVAKKYTGIVLESTLRSDISSLLAE